MLEVYISELKAKIIAAVPELKDANVFYDDATKRMVVDGIYGKYIAAHTDKENEEELVAKLLVVKEWLLTEETSIGESSEMSHDEPSADQAGDTNPGAQNPSASFPSDIQFVQVNTSSIEGIDVKSFTLMSLPSIAQFIGIRSDNFSQWIKRTDFAHYVVSAHYKSLQGTEISVPWKKGFVSGYTALIPLEILPEVLVALRHSGLAPGFPARAEQLYMLAQSTLEAVGLAISGNEDKAAQEIAKVSEGLGISGANQVIEIFKRYESKPFQISENKRFRGKVAAIGQDIKAVTGEITVGVTGRLPGAWKALGVARKLPAKQRTSGREVMRNLSPEDSVGITFSESHYIKDHTNMEEIKKTGRQGKEFYKRLKDVGLLDD